MDRTAVQGEGRRGKRSGATPMTLPILDTRSESEEVLNALRRRAIHALEAGHKGALVAAIPGVTPSTLSRWWSAYRAEGAAGLPDRRTGRPNGSGRLLKDEQAVAIQEVLDGKAPEEADIASALWTRRAVRDLIFKQTGLRLPIRTVGEYLRRRGCTPQRPLRKSRRQDPVEVKEWLETI